MYKIDKQQGLTVYHRELYLEKASEKEYIYKEYVCIYKEYIYMYIYIYNCITELYTWN